MTALKTATFYESKLVRRSWLFYFFILGILGYTIGVLSPPDTNRVLWSNVCVRVIHSLARDLLLEPVSIVNHYFHRLRHPEKAKKSGYPGSAFHATCW